MEWQSGTEYGTQHDIILWQRDIQCAKGRRHCLGFILELLGYLIGHQFTNSLHIMAEGQTVFLVTLIAEF